MIEVRPSCIVIHDYDLGDSPGEGTEPRLEKTLSVWDKGRFRYGFSAYLPQRGSLIIPRGYDLGRLQYYFPNKKIKDNSNSAAWDYERISYGMKSRPRTKLQQEAIEFLVGSGFERKFQSAKMLALRTGEGKTFCTISYISRIKKLPIIFADQEFIIHQWKEEFLKHTDLKEDDIYLIIGSDKIDALLKQKNPPYKVYIASHRTFSSYMKDNPNRIGKVLKHLRVGVKVYDEAHVEWKNIFYIDASSDVSETVYLTATPGRSDPSEHKVYQNMMETIPKFGLSDYHRDNLQLYHKIVLVQFNSQPDLQTEIDISTKNKYGFDVNAWSDFILEKRFDKFTDMITKILSGLYKKKVAKTAILVKKNNMVKALAEYLKETFPERSVGIFSTLIKNRSERDKELEKELIVTTDKSLGKAVNVPDLEVLINTVQMSSKIQTEQVLGRLRNWGNGTSSIFFDITDMGFAACRRQNEQRKKILRTKAKTMYKMNFE